MGGDNYFPEGFAVVRENALSKSSGFSEAPTSFAISTKRLWRSASVSLGFVADVFFSMSEIITN